MHHRTGLFTDERSTMADTIQRCLSLMLSCCSLLCLEDEVALRVCISFDPRDSHVMQLCSAVMTDSGNADDAKRSGGWFIWEVCVSICVRATRLMCIWVWGRGMGVLIVLYVFRLYVCLYFLFLCNIAGWCSIQFDRFSISFSACFSVWTGNSSCVHLFEVSMEYILESLHSS